MTRGKWHHDTEPQYFLLSSIKQSSQIPSGKQSRLSQIHMYAILYNEMKTHTFIHTAFSHLHVSQKYIYIYIVYICLYHFLPFHGCIKIGSKSPGEEPTVHLATSQQNLNGCLATDRLTEILAGPVMFLMGIHGIDMTIRCLEKQTHLYIYMYI